MRKVLLVHISSSGCCNTLVTMLNNGHFWLSILCYSRVFHPCSLVPRFPVPRFPLPRFQSPHLHNENPDYAYGSGRVIRRQQTVLSVNKQFPSSSAAVFTVQQSEL